ncbi:HsdM family class I SAM-dependent methyltransferase [Corynebacterium renale]|nr:N-6 DNA methylase [Corynebacterium renale]STC99792.1 type I restriction-modification system, methyltransferase subunit [Corynebacterium renale]
MQDAAFLIPSAATLAKVATEISDLKFSNKDIAGDLYEYMLSKLSTAGTNGQFRTPGHIIDMMVQLIRPKADEKIIDPACGTAGFLAATSEYLKEPLKETTKTIRDNHYDHGLTGFDFDSTMVRIAAMNMVMHGYSNPNIAYQDSLKELDHSQLEAFDVILANPPFAGSINQDILDPELAGLKTKKTELLFVQRFLTLLKLGGRAAVVVPEGVLFGSTKAHKTLRKELVDNQQIDAIIKLPSGTFKPYSGVSTAIICFTRTDYGQNENIWFYDLTADGYSLDDKRTPLLEENLLGPCPVDAAEAPVSLSDDQLRLNNLPDVIKRFFNKDAEVERARTEQSFMVPVDEIREADYDLSMNRYKEIAFDAEETREPAEIIAEIEELDEKIAASLARLKEMI